MFNEQLANQNVSRKVVLEVILKFRQTGSVANKKCRNKNRVRNETVEVAVLGQVAADSTLSTRKLAELFFYIFSRRIGCATV